MRVPISWLREYVDFDLSPATLAEKLTMVGLSVEAIEDLSAPLKGIVVGKVVRLSPHPSAEKLLLAETDWGQGIKTLVTGARNLSPGDLVPVVPAGAALPGGQIITAVDFAGVTLQGMLCSGAELGLEKQSDGILVLCGDWPPGASVAPALGLDEVVLELELTPNRADCLGLLGVAREVAAITGGRLRPPASAPQSAGPPVAGLAEVEIQDSDLCPRYDGKVFLDVRIGPSPAWMQHRLSAAGIRPINNIVDITNYVMLELNQPLHAFDLDRLRDRHLIIRRAKAGEQLKTLDGTSRPLEEGALVITDPGGPVAVAGVMGGVSSEVTDVTTRVFLEGAYFERVGIRRTAKTLAMRTEASLRFERGIDPAGVPLALDRAAVLVEQIGAGVVAKGTIEAGTASWRPKVIVATSERINGLLGTGLSTEEIVSYLDRLSLSVSTGRDGALTVSVPTYRQDIENSADLAEEVARLHGYDRLPLTYPASDRVGMRTPTQLSTIRARRLLRGLGQSEVITYSFCSPKLLDRLRLPADDPRRDALRILAPLSEDWSIMRPTLLGGILEVMAGNARRGVAEVQIFEMARVYLPDPGQELPREPLYLSGGLMGDAAPRTWTHKPRPVDYFDLKGLLEALLTGLGAQGLTFAPAEHPSLHPGRSACILSSTGEIIGHLGEAHPGVTAAYDLRGPVLLYELELGLLAKAEKDDHQVQSPPRFPAILRDLAVVVPRVVRLAEIEGAIRQSGGELLVSQELFDVYAGDQVGEGKKSMAFALAFRAGERTLTDLEVNEVMGAIVAGLTGKFGATLR